MSIMNEITTIEQGNGGFGGQLATVPNVGATAGVEQQRAIAEVQGSMVVARANPRNEMQALDRILNSCQRKNLADAAVYSYARGGTEITGPSIRLAEVLAQKWGNMQFGIREIERRNGESIVQAFAWDLETNVRREMTFTVGHARHTKQGVKRLTDERDIYELIANNGARRLRSCILSVIPPDIVEDAVDQCEKTIKANADTSPEGVQKMVNAFQEFGVVQQQIEQRIQRRLEAIQPAQVVSLKKVYASLRDGMSSVTDWFEPIPEPEGSDGAAPKKGTEAAKAALKAAAAKKDEPTTEPQPKNDPEPEPQVEQQPTDAETGGAESQTEAAAETLNAIDGPLEQGNSGDQGEDVPMWKAQCTAIYERLEKAQTLKDVNAAEKDWINNVLNGVPDDETDGANAIAHIEKAIRGAKQRVKQEG